MTGMQSIVAQRVQAFQRPGHALDLVTGESIAE
jgi:hypothetical protein